MYGNEDVGPDALMHDPDHGTRRAISTFVKRKTSRREYFSSLLVHLYVEFCLSVNCVRDEIVSVDTVVANKEASEPCKRHG